MPMRRAAIGRGLVAGFLLHTVSVLWLWFRWDVVLRRTILVWMDIPMSLIYLSLAGRQLLAASLVIGGIQWAIVGAALSYLVGRLAEPSKPA
jgi:hypothetical protein